MHEEEDSRRHNTDCHNDGMGLYAEEVFMEKLAMPGRSIWTPNSLKQASGNRIVGKQNNW